MQVVKPNRVTRTYSNTGPGPRGDVFVATLTADPYRKLMQAWESRLNHYLCHGVALPTRGR